MAVFITEVTESIFKKKDCFVCLLVDYQIIDFNYEWFWANLAYLSSQKAACNMLHVLVKSHCPLISRITRQEEKFGFSFIASKRSFWWTIFRTERKVKRYFDHMRHFWTSEQELRLRRHLYKQFSTCLRTQIIRIHCISHT